MEEKEESKKAFKLAQKKLENDTLDQQLLMQQKMDNEKKLMEQDRKSYMNDYLREQITEKNIKDGKPINNNRYYAEAAPPPTNVDLRRHVPTQEERYSMQSGAKDILRQGGNLNRAVVRSELNADQAYQEIKRKNGNATGNYNILTGH